MSRFHRLRQYLQSPINVTALPANTTPPTRILPFIWHFIGPYKWLWIAQLFFSCIASASLSSAPWFISHIVNILGSVTPADLWQRIMPWLIGYLVLCLLSQLISYAMMSYIQAVALSSSIPHLVRRQLHHYVLEHSWQYFQNDFAGRLATKIMDTSNAVRQLVRIALNSIWNAVVTLSVIFISFWSANSILLIPLFVWIFCCALAYRKLIPPIRRYSKKQSESRSLVVGRIVDTYTNIQTVKLFAHGNREDSGASAVIHQAHLDHKKGQLANFRLEQTLNLLNISLIATLMLLSLWLWSQSRITTGDIVMVLPLGAMLSGYALWLGGELNGLFEELGTLDEGIATLIKPHTVTDTPHAPPLAVTQGSIDFTSVTFAYHKNAAPILNNLTLHIPAGQKVGLIGTSGAGKSTLVNLLLRFYEVNSGTISIDNQSVAAVTQNSLRAAIGMVTQDTSLLHRSIRANIAYGRPEADPPKHTGAAGAKVGESTSIPDEIITAAQLAHAHDFIQHLSDKDSHTGYESRVGERGVKLSGGQRQRIAIARLILKNAPILIMDEATAALDSEVEHAIQENLTTLMHGKTVIAIAHRLSTISQLDRLLVLDQGRIIEDGTHAELLTRGGTYAQLWARQSGGFLPPL